MLCLILAGGFATRLYPLTINKAKALLEYKGKPVITHIVERIPQNINILVSTNKKFEADFLDWGSTIDRPVEILVEEAVNEGQKKGAVSAIDFWIKSRNITENIIIIAGDNYFEFDLADFIAEFNARDVMIAVYDTGNTERAYDTALLRQFGLVSLENNRIIRFDEKPLQPKSNIIATGIYVLPQRIYPLLSQYCRECDRDNLGHFAGYLLDKEEVYAYIFSEFWQDIGNEIMQASLLV